MEKLQMCINMIKASDAHTLEINVKRMNSRSLKIPQCTEMFLHFSYQLKILQECCCNSAVRLKAEAEWQYLEWKDS